MTSEDIFNQHWTHEQLVELRRGAIAEGHILDNHADRSFTCDRCPLRTKCIFVFASYNTDGDCLADK